MPIAAAVQLIFRHESRILYSYRPNHITVIIAVFQLTRCLFQLHLQHCRCYGGHRITIITTIHIHTHRRHHPIIHQHLPFSDHVKIPWSNHGLAHSGFHRRKFLLVACSQPLNVRVTYSHEKPSFRMYLLETLYFNDSSLLQYNDWCAKGVIFWK